MKRRSEDSSSEEFIDVGCESDHPGHLKASFLRCGSPTSTPQVAARKKRRGVIEKRRRDRINCSLSELRRLVPTAVQKQGSAKLEKAEILQMTVDHLKVLQATGGKGYFDAHALALDFLFLGFRECVTEVSRYLGVVEALDSGDPLRCRLLSHLHLASCCSRRDAAALSVTSHYPLHQQHQQHQHQQHQQHQQPHPLPHPFLPHHWAFLPSASYGLSVSPDPGEGGAPQRPVELSQRSVASSQADSTSSPSSSSSSSSSSTPLSASLLSLSASFPVLPPSSFTTSPPISSSSSSSSQTPPSSSKPYRPWGTEVGAF